MKNILLFFLSDIHLNGKEFRISPYKGRSGKEFECIQTNESAIDDVMECLDNKLDALFYFSTKKTKEPLTVVVKDSEGNAEEITKTHVEWFRERVIQKHPELENAFNSVDYDEDKDTDEGIRQVTEMTEKIKAYLDRSDDKDIHLHADMTGGFRHASMMMLSVMQLLGQYEGITIDTVLYSNWQKVEKKDKKVKQENAEVFAQAKASIEDKAHGVVENVTELHKMFTLVSGTDEFVNIGSVKEIDRYFENRKPSPVLEALINTMRDFSDAIKICDTNKIETVVKQLRTRINAFSAAPDKTVHEKIFAQIITVLKEEYGELLSTNVTQIDIIEWCIKKGFLQQAMTLCTEWLPFMLVNKKICYTEDSNVKLEALKLGEPMQREWQQVFIISYTAKGTPAKDTPGGSTAKNGLAAAIQKYLENHNATESVQLFPQGEKVLLQLFDECEKHENIFESIRKGNVTTRTFSSKVPVIDQVCKVIWNMRKAQNPYIKYERFLEDKRNSVDYLLKQIIQNLAKFNEIFGVEATDQNAKDTDLNTDTTNKWESRKNHYEYMLQTGIMKTKYPDDIMDMLKGYYDIRTKRNQINHAASEKKCVGEVEEIKKSPEELMLEYLAKLRKF